MNIKKKKKQLTLTQRNSLKGLVFMIPFLIGTAILFIYPFCFSIRMSLAEEHTIVGMKMSGWTFQNYLSAISDDKSFMDAFKSSVTETLTTFPLSIILSLIISILLNKNIKGRGFFRVIFFIPFLLGSGEVMQQILNQGVEKAVLNVSDGRVIPYNVLAYFGGTVTDAVQTVFSKLVTVLWRSGVQILLFLSGLQSISPALYEAAKIDGSTEWETFWKITVPMISPIMLLNIVYTIVDSFTSIQNPMLVYFQTHGFTDGKFEYHAALGWIYFLFIGVVVAVVFGIMKGYIHTNEVEEVRKRERQHRIITIEKAPRRTFE